MKNVIRIQKFFGEYIAFSMTLRIRINSVTRSIKIDDTIAVQSNDIQIFYELFMLKNRLYNKSIYGIQNGKIFIEIQYIILCISDKIIMRFKKKRTRIIYYAKVLYS